MQKSRTDLIPNRIYMAAAGALLAVHVTVLHAMGQPFIAASGRILLWVGNPLSPETSQQLTDWYSFSHVIHGFIFYGLLRLAAPRLPPGARLVMAMGIEIGWEIFENTPMVIQAYRKQALAVGYAGDSILNSLSDVLMMTIGFLFASRAPVRVVVGVAIAFELFTAVMIRDNLTLNVINFLPPIPLIQHWQAGAKFQ